MGASKSKAAQQAGQTPPPPQQADEQGVAALEQELRAAQLKGAAMEQDLGMLEAELRLNAQLAAIDDEDDDRDAAPEGDADGDVEGLEDEDAAAQRLLEEIGEEELAELEAELEDLQGRHSGSSRGHEQQAAVVEEQAGRECEADQAVSAAAS